MPLRPKGKAPLGALVPHGKDDATTDLATALGWWRRAPRANVGIVCGPSGFIALDVDPRNGGDDTLHELEVELGELPLTIESHSGGGGRHLLFRHPGGQLVGIAGEGLDVKDAGYIVAPPSIHPETGRPYAWSVDGDPDEVELAELPERWLQRLRPRVTRDLDLNLKVDHGDPLRTIPAAVYVPKLSGREASRTGFVQCPFHKGGQERTPSLGMDGTLWACYGACQPLGGKRVMGGNVYDFAGLLWDYPLPLRGTDFIEAKGRIARELGVRA